MEQPNFKIESPEINTGEIIKIIDSLKMDGSGGYEPFSVRGVNFLLIMTSELSKSDDFSGAAYHRSTEIDGWDIYLYTEGLREEKNRWVFHEVVGVLFREMGFDNDNNEAHARARRLEENFFGPRS